MKWLIAFAAAVLFGSAPALARWEYERYGKDFIFEGAGKAPSDQQRRAAVKKFRNNMGLIVVYSCELASIQTNSPINPEVGTVIKENPRFHAYDVIIRLDNGEEKQWPVYSVIGRTRIIGFLGDRSTKEMLRYITADARELEIIIPSRRGEDVKLALDMTGAKRQINRVCPLTSGRREESQKKQEKCTPPAPKSGYTPPEDSCLVSVRPYPNADSVCQVIGENHLTVKYLDAAALLIGCPAHETGAIANRLAEGGQQLGQIGSWVLFRVPEG